jgi:translation machinery-associated protein 16
MQQLESAEPLSLPQLHELVSRAFIGRNDARMAELESERRPGRPKAKEHLDLEELKRVEESEYASGFGELQLVSQEPTRADCLPEVFDLTNPKATRLLYMMIENNKRFKQSHVDLFPQVRISSRQPEVVVASRPGQVEKMGLGGELPDILMGGDDDDEDEMDEE